MADYIENDMETIENETALATYGTPGQIASFSDALMTDVTEQGYWASFPVETMEDKKVLFAATFALQPEGDTLLSQVDPTLQKRKDTL